MPLAHRKNIQKKFFNPLTYLPFRLTFTQFSSYENPAIFLENNFQSYLEKFLIDLHIVYKLEVLHSLNTDLRYEFPFLSSNLDWTWWFSIYEINIRFNNSWFQAQVNIYDQQWLVKI